MTLGDMARVLAKAAAYDQRTIGETDVRAWHEAIGDLDFADAHAAVTRHYRDHTERIMPAHVRRIVGELKAERRSHSDALALPGRFENDADRADRTARGMVQIRQVFDEIAAVRARRSGGAA